MGSGGNALSKLVVGLETNFTGVRRERLAGLVAAGAEVITLKQGL